VPFIGDTFTISELSERGRYSGVGSSFVPATHGTVASGMAGERGWQQWP